ncbi:MAG: hypothetical protein IPK98_02100 [Chloracidobacterium sp.]|nr:hypothetical protein [Chloracidobacterium sp.]
MTGVYSPDGLRSPGEIGVSGGTIMGGFAFVCLLVILFLMFRQAICRYRPFVVGATISGLFFSQSLVDLPFMLAMGHVSCRCRGIGGMIVMFTLQSWMLSTLFTLNFSAWYATPMFVTLALILLLLAYGFKVSIANRPIFGEA